MRDGWLHRALSSAPSNEKAARKPEKDSGSKEA